MSKKKSLEYQRNYELLRGLQKQVRVQEASNKVWTLLTIMIALVVIILISRPYIMKMASHSALLLRIYSVCLIIGFLVLVGSVSYALMLVHKKSRIESGEEINAEDENVRYSAEEVENLKMRLQKLNIYDENLTLVFYIFTALEIVLIAWFIENFPY